MSQDGIPLTQMDDPLGTQFGDSFGTNILSANGLSNGFSTFINSGTQRLVALGIVCVIAIIGIVVSSVANNTAGKIVSCVVMGLSIVGVMISACYEQMMLADYNKRQTARSRSSRSNN